MNILNIKVRADNILEILRKEYPNPAPALKFNNTYELLLAVILSAQCTDERVNAVTPLLFEKFPTVEKLAVADVFEVESIIKPCGLYKNKARFLINSSKEIVSLYNGKVPNNIEQLRTLNGVGRKTANVVYAVGFNGQAIAVDTHVFRVSNRLGLAQSTTPLGVEEQLMAVIPKQEWGKSHHLLLFHGRYTCTARSPKCDKCNLKQFCSDYASKH